MKRYFYLIILLIFLFPCFVFAEDTCEGNGVIIKSIELDSLEGTAEEISNPSFHNNKISIDLKMYDLKDAATYTFVIENKSGKDYVIGEDSFKNANPYIEYIIDSDDHSLKVEKDSEKEFTLTATYKSEVERDLFAGGKFDGSSIIVLLPPNPKTGVLFYSYLFLIVIVCVAFCAVSIKNKIVKNAFLLLILFLVPIGIYAENDNVEIDSNIMIGYVKRNPCTYDGELVQGAEYTNGQYTYRFMQESYGSGWNNITTDGWGVALTDKNSTDPVTTTLCTSINDKPIVSTSYMFYDSQTTSIDTNSLDTSNVTIMQAMFKGCSSLTKLDLSNFDTNNVIRIGSMFENCSSLLELNLDNFVISNGNFLVSMFENDNSLKKISMKNWKTPLYIDNVFGCDGSSKLCSNDLEYVDVTGWDLSNTVEISGLFKNYPGSEIRGLNTWDTSNVEYMNTVFYGANKIEELDLSSFDTSKVGAMTYMFRGASKLKELDISNFDTSNVKFVTYMFYETDSLTKLNLSNFNFSKCDFLDYTFMGYLKDNVSTLKELNLSNTILPPNLANAFSGLSNLEVLILDGANTSSATNLSSMFSGCSNLHELNLSSFNTSNVTNMKNMLYDTSNLTKLNLSNFDFSKCNLGDSPFMSYLSNYYGELIELDLSNSILPANLNLAFRGLVNMKSFKLDGVDTSSATNMSYMFAGYGGTSINISSFDTSHVTDMSYMFVGCSNLEELDLSGFDTSHVTNMTCMFTGCSNLEELDLGSFNTSSVTNTTAMFSGCSRVEKILASNYFVTSNVSSSSDMFSGCTSLVGGNGTVFNSSYVDKTYARIDASGSLGYFTRKV